MRVTGNVRNASDVTRTRIRDIMESNITCCCAALTANAILCDSLDGQNMSAGRTRAHIRFSLLARGLASFEHPEEDIYIHLICRGGGSGFGPHSI